MAVARMHKQRKVWRARDKPRFTKQRPIKRGGAYVPPAADTATNATVTALTPNTAAVSGTFLPLLTVTGTNFVAGTQILYRKSGDTTWITATATTFVSATSLTTAWFAPSSAGTWQVAVKKPGMTVSGSQNFTAT